MVLVVKCLICQKELTYSQGDPSELIRHIKLDHQIENKSKEISKPKVDRITETSFKVNSKISNNLINKSAQTGFNNLLVMNFDNPQSNPHRLSTSNHQQNRLSNGSDSYKSLKDNTEYDSKKASFKNFEHRKVQKPRKNLTDCPDGSNLRNNNILDEEENDERQALLKNKRKSKKFYKTSIERWRPVGDNKISCPRCQSYNRPTIRTQRQHTTNSSLVSTFLITCWPLCFSPCYLPEPKYENLYCLICNYHLGIFDHQKKRVISNPNLMSE